MARMIKAAVVKRLLDRKQFDDLRNWVNSQRTRKVGNCLHCGKHFEGRSVKRDYCSTPCKQAAYRKRKKEMNT